MEDEDALVEEQSCARYIRDHPALDPAAVLYVHSSKCQEVLVGSSAVVRDTSTNVYMCNVGGADKGSCVQNTGFSCRGSLENAETN